VSVRCARICGEAWTLVPGVAIVEAAPAKDSADTDMGFLSAMSILPVSATRQNTV
jgi:hypothetical protein